LLDSGNFSDNPSPAGDVKTRGLLEGMGKLGYQAANVGLRDLNLGYDAFMERSKGAAFPFISANVVRKDTGEPVFRPYVIVDVKTGAGKSLKVGVLGAVRYNPVFLKAGPEGSNLIIARPETMIARYLPEVREKSDIVVLLAALHREDAKKIAAKVEGLDLVLGAYGGAFSVRDEAVGKTWIYYSGNQGKRIGETRLFFNEQGEMAKPLSYMHYLTNRYPDKQEMLDFVNSVIVKVNAAKGAGSR
jgi:2',3'-cyclic-nucleotide 2'-phosphodiesterase (5'-nucleotidase family)